MDNFLSSFKNLTFHKFNEEVMLKRKMLHPKTQEVSIDIDEEIYSFLLNESKKYNVSIEDFFNDILYDFLLQISHHNEDLEVIDKLYLEKFLDNLISSNKDYLVVDSLDSSKNVVFLTKKDSIDNFVFLNNFKNTSI
jgi:hypothetical protein